jgi:hypothetical protein
MLLVLISVRPVGPKFVFDEMEAPIPEIMDCSLYIIFFFWAVQYSILKLYIHLQMIISFYTILTGRMRQTH